MSFTSKRCLLFFKLKEKTTQYFSLFILKEFSLACNFPSSSVCHYIAMKLPKICCNRFGTIDIIQIQKVLKILIVTLGLGRPKAGREQNEIKAS